MGATTNRVQRTYLTHFGSITVIRRMNVHVNVHVIGFFTASATDA
jgi:hypothetical protein